MEALEFCRQMMDLSTSISAKQNAFKNAIASHNQYARDATNGYGVDSKKKNSLPYFGPGQKKIVKSNIIQFHFLQCQKWLKINF